MGRVIAGSKPLTPEEMLGENQNERMIKGVLVRKGTIGAFLANCRMIQDEAIAPEQRAEARRDLLELVPAVAAVDFFASFQAKDPEIEALIEEGLKGSAPSSSEPRD